MSYSLCAVYFILHTNIEQNTLLNICQILLLNFITDVDLPKLRVNVPLL